MTKLEQKLVELGYKALVGFDGALHFSKFPTKYTIIYFEVKNGKIIKYGWNLTGRTMPKYASNMQKTVYQLQQDLEVLKKYERLD